MGECKQATTTILSRQELIIYIYIYIIRSICLWSITKKKPIFTVQLAHGVNEFESETEGVIGNARWITALACMPYGDTFASGELD